MPQLSINAYQITSFVNEPVPGSGNIEDIFNLNLSGIPAPGETWRIVHVLFISDGLPLNRAVLNLETLTCERYRSGFPAMYYMIREALDSGGTRNLYVNYDPVYARVDFVVG